MTDSTPQSPYGIALGDYSRSELVDLTQAIEDELTQRDLDLYNTVAKEPVFQPGDYVTHDEMPNEYFVVVKTHPDFDIIERDDANLAGFVFYRRMGQNEIFGCEPYHLSLDSRF